MHDHPPIQIVNDKDVPIGQADMLEANAKGLIHRVSFVSVEDPSGNILLSKRGPNLFYYPNTWDISAAGHVDAGETYLQAAERELKEEIGLEGVKLKELIKYYREPIINGRPVKQFATNYKVVVPADTHFSPDPAEVTELKWLPLKTVKELIKQHPDQVASGLVDFVKHSY